MEKRPEFVSLIIFLLHFFCQSLKPFLRNQGAIDGKEEREKSGALGKEKDRNDERTKVDCEGAQTPHSKIPKQGMRVTLMVPETQKKRNFLGGDDSESQQRKNQSKNSSS